TAATPSRPSSSGGGMASAWLWRCRSASFTAAPAAVGGAGASSAGCPKPSPRKIRSGTDNVRTPLFHSCGAANSSSAFFPRHEDELAHGGKEEGTAWPSPLGRDSYPAAPETPERAPVAAGGTAHAGSPFDGGRSSPVCLSGTAAGPSTATAAAA
ncbi:unnamed protein product, partial [Scytosiphon promiscuus]